MHQREGLRKLPRLCSIEIRNRREEGGLFDLDASFSKSSSPLIAGTHIYAFYVLQTPLKDPKDRIRLQIHNQIRATSKHSVRAFS
jgi:hypothetical protein